MPSLTERDDAITSQACYHCGETCNGDSLWIGEKQFCCSGCRTVFEILQENGLCSYYDFEERGAISFKKQTHSRFDYLDDPLVRGHILQFSDGHLARATMRLPQIHCASCVWLLENLYKINPLILRSEVNLLRKELDVSFREDQVELSEVAGLLARLGYEPEIGLDRITGGKKQSGNEANRRLYLQIGLAGFAFGNVMLFSFPDYLDSSTILTSQFKSWFGWLSIALSTPVLLFSAADYFISSWYSIRQRKISLDIPIALGITALYLQSVFDILSGTSSGYLDSFTGLVFFLLIGRVFQKKTFDALSFDRDYAAYFPLSTSVVSAGAQVYVPVSRLRVGDEIFVRNQEIVPADSILLSSSALIDYSFVTGEAIPAEAKPGTTVFAGGRIAGQGARLTVTKEVSHSYLTQLWNNEVFKKEKASSLLRISDRFGRYFTYLVMAIAFVGALYWLPDGARAIRIFTAVLIIACPCALTLAAPFALGAAVAVLGKAGFYLKNIGVVPDLAALDAIVFDKTGTLTKSGRTAVEFTGPRFSVEERQLITELLRHSTHPLARQILERFFGYRSPEPAIANSGYEGSTSGSALSVCESPGKGIALELEGRSIAIGSAEWIGERTKCAPARHQHGSAVHLEIDGSYRGYFTLDASYRTGLRRLLDLLGHGRPLYLLSGDNDSERVNLAGLFGGEKNLAFYQKPEDKLEFIKRLQEGGSIVAMVGDGLNDAGALRQSNVGIALAEDAAAFTPACDAILAAENLGRLPDFLQFAKYALRVLLACFLVSILYNVIGLGFAITGKLSPLVTAILMPISSLSVIAIAWGAIRIRERRIAR